MAGRLLRDHGNRRHCRAAQCLVERGGAGLWPHQFRRQAADMRQRTLGTHRAGAGPHRCEERPGQPLDGPAGRPGQRTGRHHRHAADLSPANCPGPAPRRHPSRRSGDHFLHFRHDRQSKGCPGHAPQHPDQYPVLGLCRRPLLRPARRDAAGADAQDHADRDPAVSRDRMQCGPDGRGLCRQHHDLHAQMGCGESLPDHRTRTGQCHWRRADHRLAADRASRAHEIRPLLPGDHCLWRRPLCPRPGPQDQVGVRGAAGQWLGNDRNLGNGHQPFG